MGRRPAALASLYVDRVSRVHRLAPQCKLVATILFVLAVVATPREAFWAFAVDAGLVVAVAMRARVPLVRVARRLMLGLPFVAFVVLLPVVARGERVDVAGLPLSVGGLWAAWNVLVKATLGVAATIVFTATTPVPSILHGLERLRLPKVFVSICSFMVRYADVITAELHRLRVARESRCHDPRWIWQGRAVAATAGTLFVRSYERGERVYLAMLSRGYEGMMPVLDRRRAGRTEWTMALALPVVAGAVAVSAWLVR